LHFYQLNSIIAHEGMPMNQMPVLEVDGKRVNQSLACCRYVAKEIGLAGNDDWENLQIDTIADTVNDFRLSMSHLSHEST
jgi:glutathione S-transferase